MGKGFKKGSGGANPLNFKVVGGTKEPASSKKYIVWVNTEEEIESWVFSTTEPTDPVKGMVWFKTSVASQAGFNALKKNVLMVYPNYCKQWDGSSWISKTAKTYKEGKALEDWITYLYKDGEQFVDITGGFEQIQGPHGGTHDEYASMDDDSIYVSATAHSSGYSNSIGYSTVNTIDLTDISIVRAIGNCNSGRSALGGAGVGIRVVPTKSLGDSPSADKMVTETGAFDISLDVSTLSGPHYVICYAKETMQTGYSNGVTGAGTFTQMLYQ